MHVFALVNREHAHVSKIFPLSAASLGDRVSISAGFVCRTAATVSLDYMIERRDGMLGEPARRRHPFVGMLSPPTHLLQSKSAVNFDGNENAATA